MVNDVQQKQKKRPHSSHMEEHELFNEVADRALADAENARVTSAQIPRYQKEVKKSKNLVWKILWKAMVAVAWLPFYIPHSAAVCAAYIGFTGFPNLGGFLAIALFASLMAVFLEANWNVDKTHSVYNNAFTKAVTPTARLLIWTANSVMAAIEYVKKRAHEEE